MQRNRQPDHPSELTSSDEEEAETETLINNNHSPKTANHHFSTFEVGDVGTRTVRGSQFGSLHRIRNYLLAAACLSAAVLVGYFFVDLRPLFRQPRVPDGSRMREAELRSLHLLRNQRDGLVRLSSRIGSRSNSSGEDFGIFRSALIEQIELNREIEKALLSTHATWNESLVGDADVWDTTTTTTCKKRTRPTDQRTIEWKPRENRYLFAICVSGQMSNHLKCLEKHMFFAAILDRVLVLPSPKLDYQYDRVIDINHINDCFGRKVVVPFEEFSGLKKNNVRIDRFVCYMATPPCFVDEEHAKRLKDLGISLAKLEAAWPEDAKSKVQKKRTVDDIRLKFSCEDEVIAVGDTFYADVEADWVTQPGGPLSHKCKTIVMPNRLISLTAERFVQTFLGGNFVALHFRRHGFLKFCNAKEESCFFPIPQAAECILRVVEKTNAPIVYLSTDAAESETNLLQSLVVLNDKPIPLIKRPVHTHMEKWDALLYRNRLGGDNQVEAMLDKTICAISNVFIGASGSTFTEDILRLRNDWGSASSCDEYLCQGEHPNFIASQE